MALLVLVALVPLMLAITRGLPGRAFGLGWLTGLVGIATAFSWVPATVARFENTSALLAVPFFVLFVGYYALQVALFAIGVSWMLRAGVKAQASGGTIQRFSIASCLAAASWWVLLEWSFPKIIPWYLGDAVAGSALLRQAADLGGVYLLSFLIVLINACLAATVAPSGLRGSRWLRPTLAAAVVLLVWSSYGAMRARSFAGQESTAESRIGVAIVQGGLQSGRRDLMAANEEAWSIYAEMTEGMIEDRSVSEAGARQDQIDLLIWPETVLRVYLRQNKQYRTRIEELVNRLGQPLLVGSLDLPPKGAGEFNSAYLFTPVQDSENLAGHGTQIYHKLRLLPFGEYVPGTSWLPVLRRWRTTGGFVPGDSESVELMSFPVRDSSSASLGSSPGDQSEAGVTSFAASICFEAIFPGAFNQLVRDGAEFLVNITDDGWFGNTAGPYQHLNATTLRAVETRRWLVRASNSGVSACVDPAGRITASLPLNAKSVLQQGIEVGHALPLYVRLGDWPVALSFGCVLAFAISRRLKRAVYVELQH